METRTMLAIGFVLFVLILVTAVAWGVLGNSPGGAAAGLGTVGLLGAFFCVVINVELE